jgi:hypothetical protein
MRVQPPVPYCTLAVTAARSQDAAGCIDMIRAAGRRGGRGQQQQPPAASSQALASCCLEVEAPCTGDPLCGPGASRQTSPHVTPCWRTSACRRLMVQLIWPYNLLTLAMLLLRQTSARQQRMSCRHRQRAVTTAVAVTRTTTTMGTLAGSMIPRAVLSHTARPHCTPST